MDDTIETAASVDREDRVATGIPGLDDVLHGGFPRGNLYLIDGDPGTGKTTLAMRFLLEGVRRGERVLYVTMSESTEEMQAAARSHGWSLDGVSIHELATENGLGMDAQYTVFQPSEVELGNTMQDVYQMVERIQPTRVVIDSLSEMRLLARDPLRYRRQVILLKDYFKDRTCTVVLLDDRTVEANDRQLHSIAHGVIRLEQMPREYGPARRRLHVIKLRGSAYRDGFHDFVIRRGGLAVFPRLVALEHEGSATAATVSTGMAALDEMLGGGLTTGTTTLITGPAGAGKSLLAMSCAAAAARDGRCVSFLLFEEEQRTVLGRAAAVGIPLQAELDRHHAIIRCVNPAELSPGEFVHLVRDSIERRGGASVVVIDSLNGYLASMPEEGMLGSHFRELFSYLRQCGVLTICTMALHGIIGQMQANVDVSYLADTVVLLRFFEREAALHRAISIVKRRGSHHDNKVRELRISDQGLSVTPLVGLHGVLTGTPQLRPQGSGT